MDARLNAYLLEHPELSHQRTLAVHYTDHQRAGFEITAEAYSLCFRLTAPGVGLASIGHPDRPGPILDARRPSLGIVVTAAGGTSYDTAAAQTPARINIFRHGPHYYDVHVFDLVPTSAAGDTLPIRGEWVWHAYPDRLFAEVRLHTTDVVEVAAAEVRWLLHPAAVCHRGGGTDGPTAARGPSGLELGEVAPGAWLGVAAPAGPAMALILATSEGTGGLALVREGDAPRLVQRFAAAPARWSKGGVQTLGCRVALHPGGDLAVFGPVAGLEAAPLGKDRFRVGPGGRFLGYDRLRGHYTIAPDGPRSFERGETFHFYDHPEDHDVLTLDICNDCNDNGALARAVYVKHLDRRLGRVEAGVVTDQEGMALPVLVQGSKNFCGENEEPFYDPGDPSYAESYFPLVLAPGDRLRLRSYHARQHWGSHPLKQVSSLQAWMPYYQMSVGVTETTCYVPFRFGGHAGIWIADLRGVSGEMWSSQPQFDNVGGHRFFHYRDAAGEHFLHYLRSRFQLISPNMCRWGMDYVTESGEATASMEIFEFPQTDQTRDFVRLRVDFQRELTIGRPAADLFLLSLDTRIQRLRYATLGFLDEAGGLAECPVRGGETLPAGIALHPEHPFIALYGCTPESGARGNNAMLVRHFSGRCDGRALTRLSLTTRALPDGHLLAGLSLPGEAYRFRAGDFLELEAMILPYGTVGDGPSVPLLERTRFGTAGPAAEASRGEILEVFPTRVRVDAQEEADFTLVGGYSTLAVLVEGFRDYAPPVLEVRRGAAWTPVDLTSGGSGGKEGHHTYLTADLRYGFVFLMSTDGGELPVRVRRR